MGKKNLDQDLNENIFAKMMGGIEESDDVSTTDNQDGDNQNLNQDDIKTDDPAATVEEEPKTEEGEPKKEDELKQKDELEEEPKLENEDEPKEEEVPAEDLTEMINELIANVSDKDSEEIKTAHDEVEEAKKELEINPTKKNEKILEEKIDELSDKLIKLETIDGVNQRQLERYKDELEDYADKVNLLESENGKLKEVSDSLDSNEQIKTLLSTYSKFKEGDADAEDQIKDILSSLSEEVFGASINDILALSEDKQNGVLSNNIGTDVSKGKKKEGFEGIMPGLEKVLLL